MIALIGAFDAPIARAERPQAVLSEPREREAFWAWDFHESADYAVDARLRHVSQQAWIYVEEGADVSGLAVARLARAFEDQIQPRLRAAYGREPFPGIDGREAITILLLDIRDDVHHRTAPFEYISGYFDAVNQLTEAELGASGRRTNQREMIYLDVAPTDPESDILVQSAAHEYAHLIAWNHDPVEARWLDEVIGQLAVHVGGMPHPTEQLEAFLLEPERSLVDWQGSPADYGQAYAFGLYLYEQLGGAATGAAAQLVQDPRDGIASIDGLLTRPRTAGTLLRDFGLALALDVPSEGSPYGIAALDLGDAVPGALPAPAAHAYGADRLPSADDAIVVAPWGLRLERYAIDGAKVAFELTPYAEACYGIAWQDSDGVASEPRSACMPGGRVERIAIDATDRGNALWLVVANPSDRPLIVARRATILLESQSTHPPRPVYLPFALAGSARSRSHR